MPRSTNDRPESSGGTHYGEARRIPRTAAPGETEKRLRRLRNVAWLLDRSIPIGPYRIGLDPIIGLLPGAGDWIGAVLSLYVFYEGARLGLPRDVLVRMAGNIAVETVVGSVPVVGDLFDFAWQANMRNLALIEKHHRAGARPRSLTSLWLIVGLFAVFVLMILAAVLYAGFRLIQALFS